MREYGSEHPAIVLPDGYFESMEEYGREVLFMRSGREALLLAAIATSTEKDKTILFPAYCCWSMSALHQTQTSDSYSELPVRQHLLPGCQ